MKHNTTQPFLSQLGPDCLPLTTIHVSEWHPPTVWRQRRKRRKDGEGRRSESGVAELRASPKAPVESAVGSQVDRKQGWGAERREGRSALPPRPPPPPGPPWGLGGGRAQRPSCLSRQAGEEEPLGDIPAVGEPRGGALEWLQRCDGRKQALLCQAQLSGG